MTTTTISDKHLNLFSNLLYVDKVRGEHATGVIKVNPWKQEVTSHKRAVSASVFLGQEDTIEFLNKDRGRIYIGHNRYATVGDKTKDEFAHPFVQDHIHLVHNGSVDRWAMDKLVGHDCPETVVDSHMVCKTIAEKGIDEAIKSFSGAFALIWWDSKERTLNFIRNKERPLFLAELKDGTIVWASEKEFIDFFVNHKKSNMSYAVEPKELPVDSLLQWSFSETGALVSTKPSIRKLSFTRIPDPSPKSSSSWYGGYYGSGGYGKNQYNSGHNYDARANALMKFYGIDAKVDGRIVAQIYHLEECKGRPDRVNVWANVDGVDVIAYFIDRDLVENADYVDGVVSNCWEATVSANNKGVTKEVRISMRCTGLIALTETEYQARLIVEEHQKEVTSIGPTFPLKCNGHTFTNRLEFVDFVGKGCTMCGKVPTTFDPKNKHMSVYATDTFTGTLNACEFICGECITD